jgi:hypothetical protein
MQRTAWSLRKNVVHWSVNSVTLSLLHQIHEARKKEYGTFGVGKDLNRVGGLFIHEAIQWW